jgi:hypothetical protein
MIDTTIDASIDVLIDPFNDLTIDASGNTKGGSITVPLTSSLTGLESALLQQTLLFSFVKQTNPNQSNRRSTVQ